ncbi:MAG: thioredoxin domain-containing protein [Candidatus Aureabacteria bacterium]|nr:thioredoxin domain-containing protein [Candidatus Auribacterota bacterium]
MTSQASPRHTNRLIKEKSPYLLQHAHNPIDWYPWGEEAFRIAKEKCTPIFLSIGYSTCHWCHVMEEESFSDEKFAAFLNARFIPIKVDREERPDIDRVYMEVCMAMTGAGGWPLTIVMTPDGEPFFAGTYFPRETQWGRPGLREILDQISNRWEHEPEGLARIGEEVTNVLRDRAKAPAGALTQETLRAAFETLLSSFDAVHGGFGGAPKFPSPHNLSFLLRYYATVRDRNALPMVEETLRAMAHGGIYDQLGFGFHRYSVDDRWLVPHFEKMLYDQAMLAIAYIEAYQATRDGAYRRIAEEIFDYVLREMTSPDGAFYSAQDADSEGEEGTYYVWRPGEIRSILGEKTGDLVCRFYGVDETGNFEDGATVLHVVTPPTEFAQKEGIAPEKFREIMEESRKKLLVARGKRIPPFRDDKVLTDWNGLMIAVLAKGAAACATPGYADAAARAAGFILSRMRRSDGRLLHRFRDGEASIPGYLDDYAFFTWGLLELYGATFAPQYLRESVALSEQMMALFEDRKEGGFFSSGEGNEKLITQDKEVYDGAHPSGNSVAALNLLRLGRMTGNGRFEKAASNLMQAFSGMVSSHPVAHTQLLIALDFALSPGTEIVIAGDPERDDARAMLQSVRSRFLPRTVVLRTAGGKRDEELGKIAPWIMGMNAISDRATAYVCRNRACALPVTGVKELEKLL